MQRCPDPNGFKNSKNPPQNARIPFVTTIQSNLDTSEHGRPHDNHNSTGSTLALASTFATAGQPLPSACARGHWAPSRFAAPDTKADLVSRQELRDFCRLRQRSQLSERAIARTLCLEDCEEPRWEPPETRYILWCSAAAPNGSINRS